ncbi:MAG: potassium-transporting ATPase subunit C, partial [Myxococcales bacterium]|nr:potassium-transporting ATPase subunit C [Myxococcales bacterium]
MISILRPAAVLLGVFTLVTGIAYPLAVTGVAQVAFPAQANGNLLERGGQVVGSALIGQSFDDAR